MAISQPNSIDKLNSPDHSLMHRQIATDPSAPVKSIQVNADGTVTEVLNTASAGTTQAQGNNSTKIATTAYVDTALPYVDVRAYGATGDGATNDTVAIQAAVDAVVTAGGGVVFFPVGNYLVTQIIKDFAGTPAHIILKGVGRDSSVISKYGAGTDTLLVFSQTNITGGHFIMEDLAINGSSATYNGIALTNLAHFVINRVYIIGSNIGLDMQGCIMGLVSNSKIYANVTGVKLDKTTGQGGSNLIKFKDCVFSANTTLAIDFVNDEGLYLEDCDIEGNGTAESNANLMNASWVNGTYSTLTSSAGNITEATSAGTTVYATNDITDLVADTVYELNYNLTLISGPAPLLYVMNTSNEQVIAYAMRLIVGANRIMFTAPANSQKLYIQSVAGEGNANYSCTFSLKAAATKGAVRIRSTVGTGATYSFTGIKGCWFESNVGWDIFIESSGNINYVSVTDSRGYGNTNGIFVGCNKFLSVNNQWHSSSLEFDAGSINIVGWVNNCVFTHITNRTPHYIHIVGTDYDAQFLPSWSTITATGFVGPLTGNVTLKQGANGKCGTFVANGTTPVTINNTSIAITDTIVFSLNTIGGTVGAYPTIQTITAATGFTVACTAGDTSIYNYVIISNEA